MAPSLIAALDRLPRPSLTEGVAAAAADGLVAAHDVVAKLWQDVDAPPMRQHAEWLLRVYGDELARPAVPGGSTASTAADTLALIERLLAEKDEPGYVLFSPGPVMTSARVKAALVHHDVCHRDDDYAAVVGRLQQKLRPVFRATDQHEMLLITGSGTAAMEMAISSVVRARQEDPDRHQRRVRRASGRDRGAARDPALHVAVSLGNAARPGGRGARAGRGSEHRGRRAHPPRDVRRRAEPDRRHRAPVPGARRHVDRRRGVGAGGRGSGRDPRRDRHLLLVREQVPALGVGGLVPVRRARGLAAHRGHRAARVLPGSEAASPVPDGPAADAVHARGVVVLRAGDGAGRAGRAGRRTGPARDLPRTQPANTARVRRPGVRIADQHGARIAHHLDAAASAPPHRVRPVRRDEGARIHRLSREGRPGRAIHPGGEHGRAAGRHHRRFSCRGDGCRDGRTARGG